MRRALLTADGLTADELAKVLDLADELGASRAREGLGALVRSDLAGVAVGLAFESAGLAAPASFAAGGLAASPSFAAGCLAARASFEVAVAELGATAVGVDAAGPLPGDPGMLAGTARALSGSLHAVVVRTSRHSSLEHFAAAATVPVLSAGSPFADPCQAVADLQTVRAYRGGLDGLKLAYLGDGGRVANSLLHAGALAGMHVAVASPPGYEPIPQVVDRARQLAAASGGAVTVTSDPLEAARGAHAVATDTWAAPKAAGEGDARQLILRPYRVGSHVMEAARPDALLLHPLPAVRGEEVAADLLDGDQSVVAAQAANLLHAQKALLLHLVTTRAGRWGR